ncbi:MAG: sigma-54 interaction domain-containing protein [Candidatus Zixiibacteriota bacterium]
MSENLIIYGNIVGHKDRLKIEEDSLNYPASFIWRDEPRLFKIADGSYMVFVDLDDQRFSDPSFLMSIATGGQKVKLIGKVDTPDQIRTLHFSKLGISELLSADDCLKRLNAFLGELETEVRKPDNLSSKYSLDSLVGKSSQINEIRKNIQLLAEVDYPSALILGETGTGKSLIAKILHHTGVRQYHNLVEVNCSAIPDELFESELFGHAKGAFTDAKTEKMGLFEYASEGTIFFDEIGNLSGSAQAKLLKVLEDKKLRKVGDINEKEINVRVIAATNLDLTRAVEEGKFREDLYYRLNLLTIDLPSLRERIQDIPDIVEYYLRFYSTIYHKPGLSINDEVIDALQGHSWPGNIRELCNIVERAVLLAKSKKIVLKDIKSALKNSRVGLNERRQIKIDVPSQGIALHEIELLVVKQVLDMFGWNKSKTAEFLNISRPRLRRILEKIGLEQNRRQQ